MGNGPVSYLLYAFLSPARFVLGQLFGFLHSANLLNFVPASVAGSTLRHNETEQCVAQVVRRITFPQPDNAGPVSVTYPFSFASH